MQNVNKFSLSLLNKDFRNKLTLRNMHYILGTFGSKFLHFESYYKKWNLLQNALNFVLSQFITKCLNLLQNGFIT